MAYISACWLQEWRVRRSRKKCGLTFSAMTMMMMMMKTKMMTMMMMA